MSKKFTDEEVVEAALCCTAKSCNTCPFTVLGVGFEKCVIKFSEYIANNTKTEPVPTTDVQEVKRGKWLKLGNDPIDNKQWICSECKGLTETAYYCGHCYYNYCPNCGARMRGDSNDG